ncbi:MAG: phosphoribosylformylglycinamidine synthase subunit PurQ [Cytophagales bacterium]|nr:phosphoribosylformylglycinamidine synthase subunit PurQ [Cytophagales bacterium]
MKFGVVIFPGSNCDEDMVYVLEHILHQEVVRLWHKVTDLRQFKREDLIVLPGGFSYGDYLRSGAIARFSPVMDSVIEHAQRGGYVLGVCNGFQILTEAGLLPGSLLRNTGQKFVCKNIYIKPQTNAALVTAKLNLNKAYKIPVAHAEGRYYADKRTLKQLNENDQIIFRYCDENGEITNLSRLSPRVETPNLGVSTRGGQSRGETNPNGSLENIAGISNKSKNVFGLMPHPERAADKVLGNIDGVAIFESILSQ